VREGLYWILNRAFSRAGVSWADCDHEDCGDGVLALIPPFVPKSVLVESLPGELVRALRRYNGRHQVEQQIRLRLALHAGEIHYDDHGVAGRAVNLAFRLLEARALKEAVARTAHCLAIITSSWFFEEVVWHSLRADRARYRPVRVAVKETETTAWIWVPDAPVRSPVADGLLASTPAEWRQSPVPHQLPARIRQFVGRARELDHLAELLDFAGRDTDTVIITAIDGAAGIGKTALALHWAHRVKDRFPDGQLHVNLRGYDPQAPTDPGQALHGFLQALGLAPAQIPADLEDKAALYRTLVAGRRMLILLDNARSADHVRMLLPGSASCLVIITSRNRLDGLAVHEGAEHLALDLLSTEDAHKLLSARLGPARLDAEPEAAAELICLSARLPLALSIVAARATSHPTLPMEALVRELRDERSQLDALDLGHAGLDPRSVFSWSYRLLPAATARLFRLLGVHPGPDIDAHASAALIGTSTAEAGALLRQLTAAHLLEEHAPHRYRFHDLLRAYAAERAEHDESAPERAAAMRRVLDHYRQVALLADFHIQRCRDGIVRISAPRTTATVEIGTYAVAMSWFHQENATLLALIAWADRHGFDSDTGKLAWAFTTFLRRSGQRQERVAVRRVGLAVARRLGDRTGEARSLCALARAVARLGRHEEALGYLDSALALHHEIGDEHGEIQTLLSYANLLDIQHQHAAALEYAQRAWHLAQRTSNQLVHADTLNAISWHQAYLGRHTDALPLCEQAYALYVGIGHPEGEANALATIGFIRHGLGQYAEAISSYERSVSLNRKLGDPYWEARTLEQLGDTYHAAGERGRARQTWHQALTIFETLHMPEADTIRAKITPSPA
jgi:tetratricopeptide (TPR) repeat protein